MGKPVKKEQSMMQMLLGKASNRQLMRRYAALHPEDILRRQPPTLSVLKQQHGIEKVEKSVALLVLEAAAAFDGDLQKEEALDIAAEVGTKWFYLSLEDCFVALQQMKSEPVYGKLNANKILSKFDNYVTKRIQKSAEISYNRHLQNKENRSAPRISEKNEKEFNTFKTAYEAKKILQKSTTKKQK